MRQLLMAYLVLHGFFLEAMELEQQSDDLIQQSIMLDYIYARMGRVLQAIDSPSQHGKYKNNVQLMKNFEELDTMLAEDIFQQDLIAQTDMQRVDDVAAKIERHIFKIRGLHFSAYMEQYAQQKKLQKEAQEKPKHHKKSHKQPVTLQRLTEKIGTIRTVIVKNESMITTTEQREQQQVLVQEERELHKNDSKSFSFLKMVSFGCGCTGIIMMIAYYLYAQLKNNGLIVSVGAKKQPSSHQLMDSKQVKVSEQSVSAA